LLQEQLPASIENQHVGGTVPESQAMNFRSWKLLNDLILFIDNVKDLHVRAHAWGGWAPPTTGSMERSDCCATPSSGCVGCAGGHGRCWGCVAGSFAVHSAFDLAPEPLVYQN
jgi:hypothetical protein